jgi:hypothetical protein
VVEAGLSNALSAVFSAPPHRVAPFQLSLLLASVFAGGAIGAPLMGLFADRYGRRLALGTALLVVAATSLLAATSTDVAWLTVCRALSGFALGAYPPLLVAYLADVLPPARRGRMTLICGAIGFLGAPAVVFLMRWLTPLAPLGFEGWRWTLVIGAIGAAAEHLRLRLISRAQLAAAPEPKAVGALEQRLGRKIEGHHAAGRIEHEGGVGPAVEDRARRAGARPLRRNHPVHPERALQVRRQQVDQPQLPRAAAFHVLVVCERQNRRATRRRALDDQAGPVVAKTARTQIVITVFGPHQLVVADQDVVVESAAAGSESPRATYGLHLT